MNSNTITLFNRLPLNIKPLNYQLCLKPDLSNFIFDGHVVITVEVNESTNIVLLNSVELAFDKAVFEINEQNKIESVSIVFSESDELVLIKFEHSLPLGIGKLYISYTGVLNDRLKGFYRSKYVDLKGVEKYAAVTQFAPVDCRRALPCWDEPVHKATFGVAIIADSSKTVLSNMPLIEIKDYETENNLKKFIFERTPCMSTYLLAFIVGEYDFVEDHDKNGVKIRVYTPLGKKECGQFALEVAVKVLPFYKEYFGMGYNLPKLDLIALGDLSFGAMENWGLITYRETTLLIDPDNSSLLSKQTVAMVVGHELAHQWFGNFVTMEWWTHLWLNEGFASWIMYLCVDYCLPEFDIWTNFVSSDWCRAIDLDGLGNSHPIEVPIGAPSEIDEIFDAISYCKGASVIRMLHAYTGDEAFRSGLHNYLEKLKYKNAVTEDLWKCLSDSSKKCINEVMVNWTKEIGFPIIKVTKIVNLDGHTILKLSQERFFNNGDKPLECENIIWKVPITVITKSSYPEVHSQIVLTKATDEINLGVLDESEWIKLNKNSVGFYRTVYSEDLLQKIIEQVSCKLLHPTDRIGLQSDMFALANARYVSTTTYLHFVEAYKNEDNVAVWKELLSNLFSLSILLLNTDYYDKFRTFVKNLIKPLSKRLGYQPIPGENSLQAMCRGTILYTLAIYEDEEIVDFAQKMFKTHIEEQQTITADLRSAIYAAVLANADEKILDTFIKMHNDCGLEEEKIRIACSLGLIKDDELIKKVLQFAISSNVRIQDSVSVITAVANSTTNSNSLNLVWSFIKENWNIFLDRYSTGPLISKLIKDTTERFSNMEKYDDVKEFFERNPIHSAQRTIQQSLEIIKANSAWLNRDKNDLQIYLNKYY